MPVPPRPGEVQQTSQSLIASTLTSALAVIWPELDTQDLSKTKGPFLAALLALVRNYGNASSVAAANFYREQRASARVGPPIKVALPPLPTVERMQPQFEWALSNLYGPITPENLNVAQTKVQGVAETLVLNQGRSTILNAVDLDRKAKGWARITEPDACSFCYLLATRGAVYKTARTAGPNKRSDRNSRSGYFVGDGGYKVHDHCRCSVIPLFDASYEASAAVRSAKLIYENMPRTGNTLNDFRVALAEERAAGRFDF